MLRPFGDDIALCTLQIVDGAAMLRVHLIPWSFRSRVHEALARARRPLLDHLQSLAADAVARLAIEAMTLRRTRQLLQTLDLLRLEIQGSYDAMRRSQARATGRPASLASIPHPLLAHDACTLFCALSLALVNSSVSRRRALAYLAGKEELPERCEACGMDQPWAVSCFLPKASVRGGMRLTAFDDPVAWCWGCRAIA
jgi:hypothetical protein